MNTVVDLLEVTSADTVLMGEEAPATITTTLYDLIAAMQAAVEPHV